MGCRKRDFLQNTARIESQKANRTSVLERIGLRREQTFSPALIVG
jgi:hypothetical protein